MTRSQVKVHPFRTGERQAAPSGEITAFFALLFLVFLSFSGILMESASIQAAKNYRRADMNRALESVFAEFQKEMLEEYDLFVLEGSYESGSYNESRILDRLSFYGAGGMDQQITRLQILSDGGGRPFLSQVSTWVKHRYGLDKIESFLGSTGLWKEQQDSSKQIRKQEQEEENRLAGLLEEQEQSLPSENNPLNQVEQLKARPLLSLILPKDRKVSQKSIRPEEQPSGRNLNKGYGEFEDVADDAETSRIGLGIYLLDHFSAAVSKEGEKQSPGGALDYELEYLIAGTESDQKNLEKTAEKLLLLRLVSNFAYLQTDGQKKAEVSAMAAVLCTLLAVPAITEAVTQLLLLAWSFGESIVDLRALFSGSRVPLVKSGESWQLQLSGLLTLGSEEEWNEGKDTQNGLHYKEYLQILLFLCTTEEAAMRSLDLIELSLRTEKGLSWFRIDHCITKIGLKSICRLRRGIRYTFPTYFGYR